MFCFSLGRQWNMAPHLFMLCFSDWLVHFSNQAALGDFFHWWFFFIQLYQNQKKKFYKHLNLKTTKIGYFQAILTAVDPRSWRKVWKVFPNIDFINPGKHYFSTKKSCWKVFILLFFCLSLVLSFKKSSKGHKHQQATLVAKLVT